MYILPNRTEYTNLGMIILQNYDKLKLNSGWIWLALIKIQDIMSFSRSPTFSTGF